jgi:hypothetical protein
MQITGKTRYFSVPVRLPDKWTIQDRGKAKAHGFTTLMEQVYGVYGSSRIEIIVDYHEPPPTHMGWSQIFTYAFVNELEKS